MVPDDETSELRNASQVDLLWLLVVTTVFLIFASFLVGTGIAAEMLHDLRDWYAGDTWIVITAALAAMACALPGVFLVLRRQSMMGDALSHTVLPGIVLAFLFAHTLLATGWITSQTYGSIFHFALFSGAVIIGIASALMTEWLQKHGGVESSAALGVVFTTFFAIGLILIRKYANVVHIDPDCVLYGAVEVVGAEPGIPTATMTVGAIVLINLLLVGIFYKELALCSFDPSLATSLGFKAAWVHYVLMGITAATLVAVFQIVGSILVIAMLIVPATTARLLTDRLSIMIVLSLCIAGLSALLGHVLALTLPPIVFQPMGFETVTEGSASTSGMMALACGILFVTALLFAPRHGLASKFLHRSRLTIRIAAEDLLGLLYRLQEREPGKPKVSQSTVDMFAQKAGVSPLLRRVAMFRLQQIGQVAVDEIGYNLTDRGKRAAQELVRSHRLWEAFMAKHFELPDDHLHESASRVEHFLDSSLREKLAGELEEPGQDPHGKDIPPESESTKP